MKNKKCAGCGIEIKNEWDRYCEDCDTLKNKIFNILDEEKRYNEDQEYCKEHDY